MSCCNLGLPRLLLSLLLLLPGISWTVPFAARFHPSSRNWAHGMAAYAAVPVYAVGGHSRASQLRACSHRNWNLSRRKKCTANAEGAAHSLVKVLGLVRGAIVGTLLAPAYSLACALTALVWSPRIFLRSCAALCTRSCGDSWVRTASLCFTNARFMSCFFLSSGFQHASGIISGRRCRKWQHASTACDNS